MVQNSEETTVKISPPILLLMSLQSLTCLLKIYQGLVDLSMASHCLDERSGLYIYSFSSKIHKWQQAMPIVLNLVFLFRPHILEIFPC